MKKLFFDIQHTGHHSEYISHLVDYILTLTTADLFYFVVSEEFKIRFPEIINKSVEKSSIIWVFIPNKILNKVYEESLMKRSFTELNLLKEYATKFNVKDVYLLYFNTFQIALIFKRVSFSITAILFLQFYRMPKDNWKDKMKFYRKYLITKLYTLNSKIKTIFILNDTATVEYLNAEFKTDIFKMLPDPIPLYNEEKGFNVYDYYNIPKNKKILLHPGAIDPRKGTYEIIEAINHLQVRETEIYALLIVGKAKSDIEKIIWDKLKTIENKNFTIVFDNTFVSNERLKSLFLQSYAILMPYKNAEASSGILGHAAAANKKVIATGKGLIKDIIEKNNLGLLLDDVTPKEIASKIEELISHTIVFRDEENSFVREHTTEKFSELVVNCL